MAAKSAHCSQSPLRSTNGSGAGASGLPKNRNHRPSGGPRCDAVNPAFIPRNHRIEAVIAAAVADDYAPFEELIKVLAKPFEDQPEFADYANPPKPEERVCQTFCGT